MTPQTERPLRGGLSEIRSGAIRTPQLLACLCATFEHADARLLLEAVLPDFGGLFLCLILQPSKQNLVFNLYGRRELNLFSKSPSQDFYLRISFKKETRRAPSARAV
jgi:hypothetical protein